jgi:hypothetical protein
VIALGIEQSTVSTLATPGDSQGGFGKPLLSVRGCGWCYLVEDLPKCPVVQGGDSIGCWHGVHVQD